MSKGNVNKKLLLIISIIVGVIIVGLVGTYAWYVWSTSDDDKTNIVTSVGTATVVFDAGMDVIGNELLPVSDKAQGIVKKIAVRTNYDSTAQLSFNLYLDINQLDEELKKQSFKYELYKNNSRVKSGDFSQTYLDSNLFGCDVNSTNHIQLLNNTTVGSEGAIYTLYIWIDGKNFENDYTMANKNFNFSLHADGQNAIVTETISPDINETINGSFAYDVLNLYNNSEKTEVYNGNSKYYYDTTNNLMSDIDGNVRYYGSTPNNYVYFNCDDYSNQTSNTCEKWRIIGVFDGKIKIVRNESIGYYPWAYETYFVDEDGLGNGYEIGVDSCYYSYTDNNWTNSSMVRILESYYGNNSYGYSGYYCVYDISGDGVGQYDFNQKLKNDSTRSMISENIWYLGAISSSDLYSDKLYKTERGNAVSGDGFDTTWNGHIGLMYTSDYGYAADFSLCSSTLSHYSTNGCYNSNWLYTGINEWLITPYLNKNVSVKGISSNGNLLAGLRVYYRNVTRPTLYLNKNVVKLSGTGTDSDPYQFQLNS